jgi:uncharacterized membrane protein (DUF485 family)
MPSLVENFASCLVGTPVDEEKKEKFGNMQRVAKETESLLSVVLTLAFYVAVVLLVAFVGATLWNETLVPAVSFAKKVGTL